MDFNEMLAQAKELTEAQRVVLADHCLAGTNYKVMPKTTKPTSYAIQAGSISAKDISVGSITAAWHEMKQAELKKVYGASKYTTAEEIEHKNEPLPWATATSAQIMKDVMNAKAQMYESQYIGTPETPSHDFAQKFCKALDVKFKGTASFAYSLDKVKICKIFKHAPNYAGASVLFAGVDNNGYLYNPKHFKGKQMFEVMGSDATFYIGSHKTLTAVVKEADLDGKFWYYTEEHE